MLCVSICIHRNKLGSSWESVCLCVCMLGFSSSVNLQVITDEGKVSLKGTLFHLSFW